MKIINVCLLVFVAICIVSCDPRSSKELYQDGYFSFPVTILNPKDTISLGDSVCFIFEVPDTVIINSKMVNPFYEGNGDGVTFPLAQCKMDTTLGGEDRPFTPDCLTYASPGTTQGGLNLGRVSRSKVYSRFYLIPKKKGVYFLWLQQTGYFSMNKEGIKGRVSYTIAVADKHHNLLINTARPQNRTSFASFLQSQEGMHNPIYGFAVK